MRPWDRRVRIASWSGPARGVVVAVAYWLLGLLSYRAFEMAGVVSAWWAPSGLALAAILRSRREHLPWVLGAIFVAAGVINSRQPITLDAVLVRSIADVAEPVVAGLLLQRAFGRDFSLRTLREVGAFALAAVLIAPTVGMLVVLVGSVFVPSMSGRELWFAVVWWGSAALGTTLFAPLLLTWRRWPHLLRGARMLEAVLLGAALLGLAVGAFVAAASGVTGLFVGFLSFPLLAWAATRFGPTGASRATVVLSLLSIWPLFTDQVTGDPWELLGLQGTYALAALTALVLSALTTETRELRTRAEAQAERAEESLAQLESALRGAPFAVAFFDRSLRFTRLNDVFAETIGKNAEAITGRALDDVLPKESAKLRPLLRSALSGEQVSTADVDTGGDGKRRAWLCSVFPVWARSDRPLGAGLVMMDVTDRRAAEEERSRLYREAEEAIRVREDFLSIASHELKTPLTPLAARLRFIQRKLAADEPIPPESIDKPMASLRKLTELINDLLDVSRIEHGRLLLHRDPQPLNEIVRQSAEPYREASPIHRIEIDTPSEPLWIDADRQRISQVFTNLIDNAIKYSPAGGTVRVSAHPHPEGVEVTVSDEGVGIPPENQERLFERFFRAAKLSYGGLGLGLYVTRDIVEHHGGRIWAESTPGKGSTFHVVLPRLELGQLLESLH